MTTQPTPPNERAAIPSYDVAPSQDGFTATPATAVPAAPVPPVVSATPAVPAPAAAAAAAEVTPETLAPDPAPGATATAPVPAAEPTPASPTAATEPRYDAPTPPPPASPLAGPQQGAQDALPNIQVNYWLSVFFTWVPALIFYFLEKDKGDSLAWRYHVANLNFSLVRTIASVAAFVFPFLSFIGEFIGFLLGFASLVLFIFHIIAAVKASPNYRAGKAPEFIFNLPMVK